MMKLDLTVCFFAGVILLLSSTAHALDDWHPLPEDEISRIAYGSCAKQWEPQPIWTTIADSKPDLFLLLGDNIYGDYHGDKLFVPTAESLTADYSKLAQIAEFSSARTQIPFMATWDNQDYGKHDGGSDFTRKEISKRAFLDFLGEPDESARRQQGEIYEAKIFGPEGRRVQIILLDNRWNRGPLIPDTRSKEARAALGIVGSMGHIPNDAPDANLLGEAQWQWLEQQLRKPAELRLIASGTQVIADQKGMQEWGNFPIERKRLFDLIHDTKAQGALLLSGNVHFSEISKIDAAGYPLYDFTSSGMTHTNKTYAQVENCYRVSGPASEVNFGLLEIDWKAAQDPVITMRSIGVDGVELFRKQVSLGDLKISR